MKPKSLPLLTALVVAGMIPATAQETTIPVGYNTTTMKAGQYNLFGLSLHQPIITSGDFEASNPSSLTDTDINFDSVLTGGTIYILEITSGTLSGGIQEIASWSGDSLITPQDLSASVSAGDTYALRKAPTIADVFGAANTAGLQAGDSNTADILWVPNGSGGFSKYYYATAIPPFISAGWKSTSSGNTDVSTTPLIYTDGMLLQRRGGTDLDIVVTGEVKVTNTLLAVDQTYTYLGSSFPAGVTLGSSGLENSLQHGDVNTADVLWFSNGSGGYTKYYYATAVPPFISAGWKSTSSGNTDQSGVAIPDAFFIQKRSVSNFNANVTAPTVN